MRRAALDRLVQLDAVGALGTDQARLTGQTLGVSERTVWRWVATRRADVTGERERFRIDDRLRIRLAY